MIEEFFLERVWRGTPARFEPRKFFWGIIAVGAAGVITSVVGGVEQSNATASTNESNQDINAANNAATAANTAATNQSNWNNYLVSRGLATSGNTPTGTVPGQTGAVNTKLPLWANVESSNGPARWVKAGTPAPATTWSLTGAPGGGAGPNTAAGANGGGSGAPIGAGAVAGGAAPMAGGGAALGQVAPTYSNPSLDPEGSPDQPPNGMMIGAF